MLFRSGKDLIEYSKALDSPLFINKNFGYAGASNGEGFANIVTIAAGIFVDSPAKLAKIRELAQKGAAGLSEITAEFDSAALAKKTGEILPAAWDIGKGDTLYYSGYPEDARVFSPAMKTVQKCLIRFAGGNLAAERTGKSYPVNTTRWKSGTGPIIKHRGADNGKFDSATVETILQLKDEINKFGSFIRPDGHEIAYTKLLSSPVCKDLISEPTALEIENLKNKTAVPIPETREEEKQVSSQEKDEPTPTPAPAPTPVPAPPTPSTGGTTTTFSYNYKSLRQYKELQNMIEKEKSAFISRAEIGRAHV